MRNKSVLTKWGGTQSSKFGMNRRNKTGQSIKHKISKVYYNFRMFWINSNNISPIADSSKVLLNFGDSSEITLKYQIFRTKIRNFGGCDLAH